MTLWPLEVAQADYFGNPAAVLGRLAASEPRAKAGLRIRLRSGAGIPFDSLSLDALPLYLHGADEQPYRLYEQLLGNACAVFVRAPDNAWVERLPTSSLRARGFDDEDALLPVVPRAFQGYRLLQEYFALPARFLFVEFSGLNRALRRCHGEELELVVLFGKHDQRLEGTVDAEQLVPFCTPAINLFPRRCDRIHLSDRVNEHHVIVDRTRPLDFEVHSLQQVSGHGSGPEQPFQPFYAVRDPARYGREQAYFSVRREPRVLSSKQRRKGPRSTYVGSETFVALVDANQAPYRHDLRQLGIAALCTNRDLPLFMPIGAHKSDFTLEDSAPVYFLQRRRWVDERPVLIELIALDAGWCPGLLDHDLDTSLMSLLRERFGLQPTRCQLAMHPTALNAAQAEPLQLAPGSPALYLERLSYAEGQRVVEFDQEFWRPDALEIVLDAAYPGA
ncbi:hypothetical protein ALP65_01143 [Pseudomonas aeruginosa]|uniref:UbiC transcription regulator-associated domain-containing protein n=9 Tax=Pseudomonas aeruginosa TaxID=287 RepID=A0A3M5EDC7_PSEAI|nr:hypothetical protein ALP65_01143 [Pseudomonas aeruginosa]